MVEAKIHHSVKSGVPINGNTRLYGNEVSSLLLSTNLDGVQNTQIRYVLEGERCPSNPVIIGLFPCIRSAYKYVCDTDCPIYMMVTVMLPCTVGVKTLHYITTLQVA